jgi:hypothetical protein
VLHYVERDDHLAALDIIDGSHALSLRDGWISVACSGVVSDLHLARAHDRLELFASAPPAYLRVQGTGLATLRYVELNYRHTPAMRAERSDTLIFHGADWGAPAAPQLHDPLPDPPACRTPSLLH